MAPARPRHQHPGQLPLFIDDKPNAGVLEMRSLLPAG